MSSRRFKRFLGVDLGGGKGKKTALALLEAGQEGVVVKQIAPRAGAAPLYDAALIDVLRSWGDEAVICVDAPLTLPACLRCRVSVCPGQDACADSSVIEMRRMEGRATGPSRDARRGKPMLTPYTQRATEVYLHRRRGVVPRETLGQGMGPLTARAAHLVRALADRYCLNDNLIEVYPRATLELLGFGAPYKKRVDRRVEILAQLSDLTFGPGVWREECRKSDHVFDAVVCAYTGYLWSRDDWQIPDDVGAGLIQDGWIWVPPERVAQPTTSTADEAPDQPRRRTLP